MLYISNSVCYFYKLDTMIHPQQDSIKVAVTDSSYFFYFCQGPSLDLYYSYLILLLECYDIIHYQVNMNLIISHGLVD